jgi:hypothetical protein
LDADIIFYNDIKLIYEKVQNSSVGIIMHRHNDETSPDGKYNCSVNYFNNDDLGKTISDWWNSAMSDPKYKHLSTCFEQKYLEGFLTYFAKNKVCIMDDDSIGHGAPWNYKLYDYSKFSEGKIRFNGKDQIFLLNHFSRFKPFFKADSYSHTSGHYDGYTNKLKIFENKFLSKLYDDYYNTLKLKNLQLEEYENTIVDTELDVKHKKCLFVNTYYSQFLNKMHTVVSSYLYDDALDYIQGQYFGDADLYSNGLKYFNWDAIDVILNSTMLQKKWCEKHNIQYKDDYTTLIEQIKSYKPDVIYIHDLHAMNIDFLRKLKSYAKIVAQHTSLEYGDNHKEYDYLITGFPHYAEYYKSVGLKSSYIPFGFDERISKKLPYIKYSDRKYDFVFVGGFGKTHEESYPLIKELVELGVHFWGYGADSLPFDINKYGNYHGEAWGMQMFEIYCNSKVAINRHHSISNDYISNMRSFEITGCGSVLLNDCPNTTGNIFKVGTEALTYSSIKECVEIIKELKTDIESGNISKLESIAKNAKLKVEKEFSYRVRMNNISDALNTLEISNHTTECDFVTNCTRDYLPKFIIMKNSLLSVKPDANIWMCCIDDNMIGNAILEPFLNDVNLIRLKDIESEYPELLEIKVGRTISEYCWTLKPFILQYVQKLNRNNVTWIDSDLKFYRDPTEYITDFDGDVLLHKHDFCEDLKYLEAGNGTYNAGFLSFKNTPKGRHVLDWWRIKCLNWCFRYEENGKMSDQMYLNHFHLISDVYVESTVGFGISPWNIEKYDITINDNIYYANGEKLIFYHFHALDVNRIGNRLKIKISKYSAYNLGNAKKILYFDYIKEYKSIDEKINGKIEYFEIA